MRRVYLLAVALVAVPSLADAQQNRPGLFAEPEAFTTGINFAARRMNGDDDGKPSEGFYAEMGNMVTGAGWISAGPGYRRNFLGNRLHLDTSAGLSWRWYKMAQARLEAPDIGGSRVTVGSQLRWQDLVQVSYFGLGPGAPESDRSEFRLKSTNLAGYATMRATEWLEVGGKLGWLSGPSLQAPAGAFKRGNPATADLFADDPVFALDEQPSFTYAEASITGDTRNAPGYPTRGGLYRAAWSVYSDRGTGAFNFRRFEAEGVQAVRVAASPVVLALHGWLVASHTSPGQTVPFYLLPSLGGNNTIRGYTDYRFHDRHAMLVSLEARVPLFTHLDAALLFDAGNVAPRVGDLNLGKRSYGVGFRVHTGRSTLARLDIARADEGWHVVFRLTDPLQLSRLNRRTAPVPFAP